MHWLNQRLSMEWSILMKQSEKKCRIIACSIFQAEIQYLIEQNLLKGSVEFLDSMYHMHPAQLEIKLDELLQTDINDSDMCNVLVYGECYAGMSKVSTPGVYRTNAMNCIELVLGREQYRKLRKEGAFFLLPEWTHRWQQVFSEELGLNERIAKDFFGEMHKRLIYLDTGIKPVPHNVLNEVSVFTGLPVQVLPVTLDKMLKTIMEAMKGALV